MLRESEARAETLAAGGWMRRFVAEPDRCSEAKDLYESLGLEVHLESLAPETAFPECADCHFAACLTYKVVYTRPRVETDLAGLPRPARSSGRDEHAD